MGRPSSHNAAFLIGTVIDDQVALAQAHNTPIIFTFGGVPAWAAQKGAVCTSYYCAGPPASTVDLTNFATAVAYRYKGKFAAVELWNEPDSPGQWTKNCFNISECLTGFVSVMKAEAAAYAAADSSAQFATPGFDSNSNQASQSGDISAYFRHGGGFEKYLAFHWYPRGTECNAKTGILTCAAALPEDIQR